MTSGTILHFPTTTSFLIPSFPSCRTVDSYYRPSQGSPDPLPPPTSSRPHTNFPSFHRDRFGGRKTYSSPPQDSLTLTPVVTLPPGQTGLRPDRNLSRLPTDVTRGHDSGTSLKPPPEGTSEPSPSPPLPSPPSPTCSFV